tara:strand:- start:78 stop:941 length:864 start_codon:yes stop_codon:yes gene_type:complete
MSWFSEIGRAVAPVAAVIPGPHQPFAIAYQTANAVQDQQKMKKDYDHQVLLQQQRGNPMEFRDTNNIFGGQTSGFMPPRAQTTANAGFGSGFGSFLSDVSSNIVSPIAGLFGGIKPFFSQQSSGQPALATRGTSGGQESQGSGQQNAFIGGTGNLLGQAAKFLKTPGGSALVGGGSALVGSMFGGGGQTMRITRKMKSQYRSVLNLNMGNIDAASQMLGVSSEMFVQVLLKRFRNDGAVVTKAALRKTKRTVNRLKGMCDMYDSLRPSATRRKAPMRRASTTLISNK